ncbi:MAG: hypothetical protein J6J60_08795 [Clostridia bacterium]|nr:hypothetical protein [Clostridia bacterium]MBP3597470.1 hypothetical protein [Clostridia bacterium]
MEGDFTIMERDLYYYIFENNQERYNEVLYLLKGLEEFSVPGLITEEQRDFLRKLYLNLLFRIAFLEYRGYNDEEISKMLNLNKNFIFLSLDNLFELKRVYREILDKFIEIFEEVYKSVIVNENIQAKDYNLKKRLFNVLKK